MNSLIANEDAFSYFMSFLSIQDRVKLSYSNIGYKDPEYKLNSDLIKFCCRKCSFDNVSIQFNLCTMCIVEMDQLNSFRYISYDDANKLYKFSNKKLDIEIIKLNVDYKFVCSLDLFVYDRVGIQKYVDSQFKSKKERLMNMYKKKIAKEKRDIVAEKKKEELLRLQREAELKQKAEEKRRKDLYQKSKEELNLYIRSNLSDKFVKYIDKNFLCMNYANGKLTKSDIDDIYNRYNSVINRLSLKNIVLREDSKVAREYIKYSKDILKIDGDLEDNVINEIEEMNFLYSKCNYACRLKSKLNLVRSFGGYYILKEQIAITKAEIFSEKCANMNSLKNIPTKWLIILNNCASESVLDDLNNFLYQQYIKYIKIEFEEYDEF